MTSTQSFRQFRNRQPCQTLTTKNIIRSLKMDSLNPFPVATVSKSNVTQVYNESLHHALSLPAVVNSVRADMEGRDVFLMTQVSTSWARPGPAGNQSSSSSQAQMYSIPNHTLYPTGMISNPHQSQLSISPAAPLSSLPSPELPLEVTVPVSNYQQHDHQQQFQQQQQHQDLSVTMEPQSEKRQQQHSKISPDCETNFANLKGKKGKSKCNTASTQVEVEKKKRASNPLEWKKRKKKLLRDKGEEYITVQGKVHKARCVQPIECSKCRFRCSEKIPEEARQAIHKVYWNLASYERQRAFIAQHVEQNDIKQVKSKTGARREVANSYFFVHKRKEYRVCKAFFTKTLDITSKVVDYTMKKTECGVYVGRDERGRRDPVNKTKPEDIEFMRWHIDSFPTVDGAKAKKNSRKRKQYLSHDLNVGKMYSMYKELCEQTGRPPKGISVYRNTFNKDFNLAFQKLKKEHCASCKCGEGSKAKMKSDCNISSSHTHSQPLASVSGSQVLDC